MNALSEELVNKGIAGNQDRDWGRWRLLAPSTPFSVLPLNLTLTLGGHEVCPRQNETAADIIHFEVWSLVAAPYHLKPFLSSELLLNVAGTEAVGLNGTRAALCWTNAPLFSWRCACSWTGWAFLLHFLKFEVSWGGACQKERRSGQYSIPHRFARFESCIYRPNYLKRVRRSVGLAQLDPNYKRVSPTPTRTKAFMTIRDLQLTPEQKLGSSVE